MLTPKVWRLLLVGLILFLSGCTALSAAVPPTIVPPTAVPITDASGTELSSQEGQLWVLLSGVDEHGLIAEHELTLLTDADAASAAGPKVHTGIPAIVEEIRQTGPQNLHRFYRVKTAVGQTGWISDYYVRRLAYLFNEQGEAVALYAAPEAGSRQVASLGNVSPVLVREANRTDWWIVQTADRSVMGWVEVSYIKESPEPEFLLSQQHDHSQPAIGQPVLEPAVVAQPTVAQPAPP